jgi:hypothetical protein
MHRDSDCNASFQLITVAMRHPIAAGVVHQVFGGIVRSKRTRKQMSQTMSVNSDMLADAIVKAMLRLQQMNTQPSNSQTQLQAQGIFDSIGKFLSGAGQQVIQTVGPTIVKQAENWLGGLLSSLSNEPQFQQQIRSAIVSGQVSGVNPQSIFGDAFDWFKNNIGNIAQQAAPIVIKALPGILAALANQPQVAAPQQGQQALPSVAFH